MAHILRRIKNESRIWRTRINEAYNIIEDSYPTKIEVCLFNIGYVPHLFIMFEISFEYPFKPPKLYLNGKDLKRYLPSGKLFRGDLKKIIGSDCLCCSSINCNWGPTLSIINLVDEIRRFFEIKLKLVELFFLKKICKNMPDEINNLIITYL